MTYIKQNTYTIVPVNLNTCYIRNPRSTILVKGGILMINCLEWGNNHKLYRKDYIYLKLLAYEKTFYFSNVKLNGMAINRKF